jgi:putative Holliday junction resolvase
MDPFFAAECGFEFSIMANKILAVDPGDRRIGLAISDESGTIANPLTVILHMNRVLDVAAIAQVANEHTVVRIIVGQALDSDNYVTPQGRKAARLAEAIRSQTNVPVELWDEDGSTQEARQAKFTMKVSKKKRSGHLDDIAATIILQNYLDAQNNQL